MQDLKIGKILNGDEKRDAIHVAVAPVTADETLYPGQHVGLVRGVDRVGNCDNTIGIVDPFLSGAVPKNHVFWLFLYPNTVTSLRHEWTHPAFAITDDEKKQASIEWLTRYAESPDIGLSYDEIIEAARGYIKHGDYMVQGGRWEGVFVHDEFWDHYEIATGEQVLRNDRGSFFSCSC